VTAFIATAIREVVAAALLILAVVLVGALAAHLDIDPIRTMLICCFAIMAAAVWGDAP
jgi:uncharacterized membrane protein